MAGFGCVGHRFEDSVCAGALRGTPGLSGWLNCEERLGIDVTESAAIKRMECDRLVVFTNRFA